MEEAAKLPERVESAQNIHSPNDAPIQQVQSLLKAKDDTSRFVGLALLKSVLDNRKDVIENSAEVCRLWESISPKFLDRLLRAQIAGNGSRDQAKDMVDLAVAVLHIFTIILPDDIRKEDRLIKRIAPLVNAIVQSSKSSTELILQTLLTLVSQVEGALELMKLDNWSPLTEIAIEHPLVLDIISYTWINAATVSSELQNVQNSIDSVMQKLLLVFQGTDAVTFLRFCANFIKNTQPGVFCHSPKWLEPLTIMVRKLVMARPTPDSRSAYTQLAAVILQEFPETSPGLLFRDDGANQVDKKPFSYLFINLVLIDLRSSFPTLLEKLNSAEYPDIAQRLTAAFDVLSSFIGFLVRSLYDETRSASIEMPPDLLLTLRKTIAETMSLTIEYFRDRWDASIAGAAGLHPEARTKPSKQGGDRHTLTWESKIVDVKEDPLILAGIRTLAIWIREDENENLRKETAGLMDMFMELYKSGSSALLDFRYPILLALEGIIATEDGLQIFLDHEGWQILFQDLESILTATAGSLQPINTTTIATMSRGVEVVRVLISVADQWNKGTLTEDPMKVVILTASMKMHSIPLSAQLLELQIAVLQLSAAILSKAHDGLRKRYKTYTNTIIDIEKQLGSRVNLLEDRSEAAELMNLLEDVSLDLENI
ncbi:Neurochondrin-domain-containing protein [Xylogone sp. PMI_703]|nr:Neurochondrin-domain-containing protein [Xylogone sp. PMI_703]